MKVYQVEYRAVITLAAQDMQKAEVLQLFDFAEKPLLSRFCRKIKSLILMHLGKAVFEQTRDFSEESNLCNTSR
jgi:hypothetical protein